MLKENIKSKRTLIISIIVFVLVAVLVSTGFYFYKYGFVPRLSKVTKVQPPLKILLVSDEVSVKLYVSPNTSSQVEVSAFQIQLQANTDTGILDIKTNTLLEDQGWTFPLVKKEGETIKIAGFRLGNTPYVVGEKGMLIATVANNSGSPISFTADIVTENTIFYSSDAITKIDYELVKN